MMKSPNRFYLLILSFTLLMLAGCVGTVQEAAPPEALKQANPPSTFAFTGLITARGISHNKVELEFLPHGSSDVTYSLFVNGSGIPIPIDPASLLKIAGGRSLYTVDGLLPNREYKFKVTAFNTKTAAVSKLENEVYARTFDNVVANFTGISKVSLRPGDTQGAVVIDWLAPTMSGIFTAGPFDPAHYEITVISTVGGLANINNSSYTGTDRRVILVPTPPVRVTPLAHPSQSIVDGLQADTQYFFQVRAINTLYQNFAEDPTVTTIPVSREGNTRYLSIKTTPPAEIPSFAQSDVILANAPGMDGSGIIRALDKVDVFWKPGEGTFTGYRIYKRKYDGVVTAATTVTDVEADDRMNDPTMIAMYNSLDFTSVGPAVVTERLTGLETFAFYQVKVVLCRIPSCPVASTDPNVGIISEVQAIQVRPTLAPFNGVNNIQPPGQFSEVDTVKLTFDPPLLDVNVANEMEFYCVDPTNHNIMVKMEFGIGNKLVGSAVANCNDLYLDGVAPPLSTYSFQKVRGLQTDGTREYCFSASPVITAVTPEMRIEVQDRIVRCSYPEVFPPTVAQFPGLSGTCAVSGVNGDVTWSLPTGGIYSNFQVFWREKTSVEKFSYPEAVTLPALPAYSTSGNLGAAVTSYTATNLTPGKTYQIGVLAKVDRSPATNHLWSEYNLKVLDCVVPLPVAKFKSFSRIFAVGPKVDGRLPNDAITKAPPISAWLYEAINAEGIPYEIGMDSATTPNGTAAIFLPPPGRDFGNHFGLPFDGIQEETNGFAMSKNGIVSLAWEEVEMLTVGGAVFPEADTIFRGGQPAVSLRTGRTYGYKVFRSIDNKLTWKELTTTNGLIHTTDYTYRNRANTGDIIKKMGFFTDYSVKSLQEKHEAAIGDIERARIYYYKIVPIFDGKLLSFSESNHHIVRVTLPPPNMALVHRWMANRARCLELNKIPNLSQNYTCTYNGIGAKPLSIPHRVGDTVLDLGGDLLVDRYELGCRYTRGDPIAASDQGASHFDKTPPFRNINDDNRWSLFRGFKTFGNVSDDENTPFKGCTGLESRTRGLNEDITDYPPGFSPTFNKTLQGDCIGFHSESLATNVCLPGQFLAGHVNIDSYNVPGAASGVPTPDCALGTTSMPASVSTKFYGTVAANWVMQSEFLAVFHNTGARIHNGGGNDLAIRVEGPSTTGIADTRFLSDDNLSQGSQCSINLAAIDGTGYMKPRWLTIENMNKGRTSFKGATNALFGKTVNELTEVRTTAPLTFYNGQDTLPTDPTDLASFKLPVPSLRASSRYRPTTQLAKIFSSNSSKLPPLGKLNLEAAEGICATYKVQVGFASENGTFSAETGALSKRPMRRPEAVVSAAWPDSYSDATIDDIEQDGAAIPGSCNNTTKAITGTPLFKGDPITNRSNMSPPLATIPLLTGSSQYYGLIGEVDPNHTSRCISRFGIQDIVGNVSEYNSERIFCDYSMDAIFLGPITAPAGGGQNAVNRGAGGPDINFWNDHDERRYWAVLKDGSPNDGSNTSFELQFRDVSFPTRTDYQPWVRISTDSGYCSFVDDEATRRTSGLDIWKDPSTGVWAPLFNPGGSLNTTIIDRPQPDQAAVLDWRNGDGRFLDFGPFGMGPPIKVANNLGLTLDTGNRYFNSVIGFPLQCNTNSCKDGSLSSPIDNTYVTTTVLKDNITALDVPAVINDFPVGNSAITHAGITDFTFDAAGFTSTTVKPSNGLRMLTAIIVDDPITMGNPQRIEKSIPGVFNLDDPIEYYRVVWAIPRGSDFSMTSGGKSNIAATGRYTSSLAGTNVNGSLLLTGTEQITSGARCSVLINQD